tara:strand:- start:398 stop:928 length:531 start_codon:yes stop_codon:yes gene_type:complete
MLVVRRLLPRLAAPATRTLQGMSRRHLVRAGGAAGALLAAASERALCDAALTYVQTASGLRYADEKIGEGEAAAAGVVVAVHYTGRLENGKVFDSSLPRRAPIEFVLGSGQVIKGWDEGIAGMKPGGKRQLIIPAALGYGARGAGGLIPPNATLLFECELVAIKPAPTGFFQRFFG